MSESGKPNWTPGPWALDLDDNVIGADGTVVARVPGSYGTHPVSANAHLIAAAPALAGYVEKRAQAGDAEAVALMEAIHGR